MSNYVFLSITLFILLIFYLTGQPDDHYIRGPVTRALDNLTGQPEDQYAIRGTVTRDGETTGKIRLLAQQGDATAQYKLGVLYKDGRGVGTNYEKSAKWFRLAAEQGQPDAQNSLSFAYAKGKGVDRNYLEAYKWASLAATQSAEKTLVERETLTAIMSEAEIAEAERLARAWKPKSAAVALLQFREETERAATTEAQRMLRILGYKLGNTDGVAGPRTRAAISDFQLRDGMPTTGVVSRELIARLRNQVPDPATSVNEPSDQLSLSPVQRSEPSNQLGPGDRLAITVLGEPGLSGEFEIDASGKIMFPLVGEFDAGKLTAEALAKSLTEKLLDGYLKNPNVSAEIVKD